ncbi:hypothetical protein [Actinoallomurus iriomotensis]|uniref:Uncharacterized protein n=1 Tax=Actinoallomurus iriomotensis TaxID=478107 RepID=A0A9W6RYH6_9ACTN|nr:hypothetical protein [Actinoallomurus iriomotensis]GLY82427.1 hypothetical protein Airi02_003590 [Actinoallomurus iriomotensis]
MISDTRLVYRLLVAVDVERYSARSAMEQLRAQTDLRQVLDDAASHAGLDRALWHKQVRGDGELAVLPPEVDVPGVVGSFVQGLETAMADLNDARVGQPSLRLRLALHHGTLAPGPFGPIGDAPIVVSRLLDAGPVRKALADRQHGDLGLVISDTLFHDIVRTGFCSLAPADFEPIRVTVKGTSYRGHVRAPRMVTADATVVALAPRRFGGQRT